MREDHEDLKDQSGAIKYAPPKHRNRGIANSAMDMAPELETNEQHDEPEPVVPTQPAPPQQPAKTTEQIIAEGMDAATNEITRRIDGLCEQLQAMRAFVVSDAERIKSEITSHIAVRDKANELCNSVKGEMTVLNNRIGNDK